MTGLVLGFLYHSLPYFWTPSKRHGCVLDLLSWAPWLGVGQTQDKRQSILDFECLSILLKKKKIRLYAVQDWPQHLLLLSSTIIYLILFIQDPKSHPDIFRKWSRCWRFWHFSAILLGFFFDPFRTCSPPKIFCQNVLQECPNILLDHIHPIFGTSTAGWYHFPISF